MTDKRTYEDVLIGLGETSPLAPHSCPKCNSSKPPFTLLVDNNDEIISCVSCYTTLERNTKAVVEAEEKELTYDTWEGDLGSAVKAERNQKLDKYQWAVFPTSPLSTECVASFQTYLSLLHRISVDYSKPSEVEWPQVPSLEYP